MHRDLKPKTYCIFMCSHAATKIYSGAFRIELTTTPSRFLSGPLSRNPGNLTRRLCAHSFVTVTALSTLLRSAPDSQSLGEYNTQLPRHLVDVSGHFCLLVQGNESLTNDRSISYYPIPYSYFLCYYVVRFFLYGYRLASPSRSGWHCVPTVTLPGVGGGYKAGVVPAYS